MKTYQEMPLAAELHKALEGLKFTQPTEIQNAVIPLAIKGNDLMACAETGSGKTAAYGIPMVSRLLADDKLHALIMAPTRELVHQIADFLRQLTEHCEDLRVTALVGGAEMRKQLQALKRKPRIIVATPGRLIDHLRRKSLQLKTTGILVLDEGDRMLDMGFAPQLEEVLKYLPSKRQTSLFSATLPVKVQKLAESYLSKPEKISVGRASLPVESIKQTVVEVKFKQKDDRIVDELNERQGSVIVFARTKHRANLLWKNLMSYGFSVEIIHGDRTQGQRNRALSNFRKGRSRILCATDIAARGIDVPEVEHVINFDLPRMDEDYVHRIGRTARNGATGEAVSFVTPDEHRIWQALARKYKITGVDLKGTPQVSAKRKAAKGKTSRRKFTKTNTRGSGSKEKGRFAKESAAPGKRSRPSKAGSSGAVNSPSRSTTTKSAKAKTVKKKNFTFTGAAFKKKSSRRTSSRAAQR